MDYLLFLYISSLLLCFAFYSTHTCHLRAVCAGQKKIYLSDGIDCRVLAKYITIRLWPNAEQFQSFRIVPQGTSNKGETRSSAY